MDRLDNAVRRYAWGSANDIPEFLGLPPDGGPQAELWMGAHPSAPSMALRGGESRSLRELIAEDPDAELGPHVAVPYGGQLPFLFKVLAVGAPLSLQVHPDKRHAHTGYTAEVGEQAAERDYLDANYKPELVCALREGFEALCGFRPVTDTFALLRELAVPELDGYLHQLAGSARQDGAAQGEGEDVADRLRAVVTTILTGQADHSGAITAIQRACQRIAAADSRWARACAVYATLAEAYPRDPGVLVGLLLNHVVLAKADALFVAPGVAHCYLRGFAAEIMASSDNVLRAGFTDKRVNVAELLRVIDFRPSPLRVLRPQRDGDEENYSVPVGDFRLGWMRPAVDGIWLPHGLPQILLCVSGAVVLRAAGGDELKLCQGQSAYLAARCADVMLIGPGTALRATVGS